MNKQPLMRRVQQWHLWLGVLFAPSILFFALTGALQTFNLHEGPHASPLIAQMASVHKNQRLMRAHPDGPQREHAHGPKPGGGRDDASGPSPLPLKIYVLLMSVGLIVTTLLGIWMAFKYSRSKIVVWGLLAAGTGLPLVLLFV